MTIVIHHVYNLGSLICMIVLKEDNLVQNMWYRKETNKDVIPKSNHHGGYIFLFLFFVTLICVEMEYDLLLCHGDLSIYTLPIQLYACRKIYEGVSPVTVNNTEPLIYISPFIFLSFYFLFLVGWRTKDPLRCWRGYRSTSGASCRTIYWSHEVATLFVTFNVPRPSFWSSVSFFFPLPGLWALI